MYELYFMIILDIIIKFIYSDKPQNFAKSSPNFWLQYIQSKVRWRFRKNFVAFSEYMNFICKGDSRNIEKSDEKFTSELVGQEEIVSSSLETLFRNLNSTRCASSFKSHPPTTTSRLVWPQFLSLKCDNYVPQ